MSSEKLETLQKLTVSELKEMCRDSNLRVSGTKHQLLMRLCGMSNEKPKAFRKMPEQQVNRWLEKQGVKDIEKVSKCLKAGIQKGHIDISGDNPLDNIVIEDSCFFCDSEVVATIRDVLYQSNRVEPDTYAYEELKVKCHNKDCELDGLYVIGMCFGHINIDTGKYHHHCTICPGFGKCIGDSRDQHCMSCGEHYFAGSLKSFPCPCKEAEMGYEKYMNSFLMSPDGIPPGRKHTDSSSC